VERLRHSGHCRPTLTAARFPSSQSRHSVAAAGSSVERPASGVHAHDRFSRPPVADLTTALATFPMPGSGLAAWRTDHRFPSGASSTQWARGATASEKVIARRSITAVSDRDPLQMTLGD
jgi:hypothetical protein